MVIFDKIAVRNINSFKQQEFDFSSISKCVVIGKNLDSDISESNGSGKSTLFSDAIIYAIYGKTDRRLKNKNIKDNEESFVELKFYYEDDYYVIKRYVDDFKNKNKVEVYVNNSPLMFNTIKESNMFINRIFTLSYDNFVSSIIFKQGFEVKISQLTSTKRKEYFYSVIDYDFDLVIDKAKKDLKILNSKIDDLFSIYVKIKSEISYLKGKLDVINSQYEDANIEEMENNIKKLTDDINSLENKVKEVEFNVNLLNLEKMTEYKRFVNRVAELKEKLNRLEKLKDGKCPLCNSDIDSKEVESDVMKIKKEMKCVFEFKKEELLNEYTREVGILKEEINDKKVKLSELNIKRVKFNSINMDKSRIIKELESKETEFEEVCYELEELKQSKEDLNNFIKLISPSGKLRTVLLTYYIEVYNTILNNILENLFGEFGSIKLKISDDMKGIDIEGIDYKSLSGGEKRRFDFVLQLAFSDFITYINNFDCNIRVLDESFDTLDKSSIIHILDYVKDVFYNKKIICISHNSDLKTFFDDVVYVVKEDRESKIVSGEQL